MAAGDNSIVDRYASTGIKSKRMSLDGDSVFSPAGEMPEDTVLNC